MRNEELVKSIQAEFKKRQESRRSLELQWRQNGSFLNGRQYMDISAASGELLDYGPRYAYQNREVFNHIAPIMEARMSRLKKVIAEITADDNDPSFRALLTRGTYFSETAGTVFYKLQYASRPCTARSVSPFELYPDDLAAPDLDSVGGVIHATMVSGGSFLSPAAERAAELKLDYYESKSGKYKNGRHIVIVGDELLHDGSLPAKRLSDIFIRQTSLDAPAGFFGHSLIERLIPLQRAYNAVKNRKHELIARLTAGILAVEDGSVDTDELERDGLPPGKILVYRPGARPPEMLNFGSVPKELEAEEERLLAEFSTISGVSELGKYGGIPRAVTSGIALTVLEEEENMKVFTSAEEIRSAHKYLLKLLKKGGE